MQIESIQRFNFERDAGQEAAGEETEDDETDEVEYHLLCKICDRYATSSSKFRLVDNMVSVMYVRTSHC